MRHWATALLLLTACVPTPDERTSRYGGPIAPCDVDVMRTADGEARVADDANTQGPYFAWNTHAGHWCNDNPRMAVVAERTIEAATGESSVVRYRDRELYITYPTTTQPTVSGAGAPAPGRHPVIVFSHANNDRVCKIFESYYSLHDQWASWGWVVASVDGTPFNCKRGDRLNLDLRTQAIGSAIDRLRELDADPSSRFFGALDLQTIVLAGHSRGGGASLLAARGRDDVVGVISLQGIDPRVFGFAAALDRQPVLAITAGNDVDLNYPRVEPVEDLLRGPYTWVNLNGGIHAYTADVVPLEFDDRPQITRNLQHQLTNLYTTAFLQHVRHGDEDELLYTLRGNEVAQRISAAGVYQRWRAPGNAVWIDRFNGEDPSHNDLGGRVVADGFLRFEETTPYAATAEDPAARYVKSSALMLSAAHTARYTTEVPDPIPGATAVTFRAKGPDFGVAAPLTVEVSFDEGPAAHTTIDARHRGPLPLSNRYQQVVVPITPSAPIEAITLQISGGTLFIDDLRLLYE